MVRPARIVPLLLAAMLLSACGGGGRRLEGLVFVADMGSRDVAVFDGGSWQRLATIELPGGPHAIDAEPGGARVWAANIDRNSVTVIDAAERTIVKTIKTCDSPTHTAFAAGKAIVGCGDGYATIVTLSTLRRTARRAIGFAPHGVVSGPGGRVWTANRGSNDLSEFDPVAERLVGRHPAAPFAYALDFSPDGTYGYITSKRWHSVVVMSMSDKRILGSIPVGNDPALVVASRDGKAIYVANRGSNSVSVIDGRTFQVAATVPVGSNPHGLALSGDGRLLLVANHGSGTVSVVDTQERRVVRTVRAGDGPNDVELVPRPRG